jgi:hypothetical protein
MDARRLKIASQAEMLSRQIWASFPIQARRVFALQQILKLAFGDDLTSLGIAALRAMDASGVDGPIARTGKTVGELSQLIRSNQASKLKTYADVLGRILTTSIKGLDDSVREEAITHAILTLSQGRAFTPGGSIASAVSMVQTMLKNKALNVIRSQRGHMKREQGMASDDYSHFMADPRALKHEVSSSDWEVAMKELKAHPLLQNKGFPLAYLYIQHQLRKEPLESLAEQMGYSGGAGAMSKWYKEPSRRKVIREILAPLYEQLQEAA